MIRMPTSRFGAQKENRRQSEVIAQMEAARAAGRSAPRLFASEKTQFEAAQVESAPKLFASEKTQFEAVSPEAQEMGKPRVPKVVQKEPIRKEKPPPQLESVMQATGDKRGEPEKPRRAEKVEPAKRATDQTQIDLEAAGMVARGKSQDVKAAELEKESRSLAQQKQDLAQEQGRLGVAHTAELSKVRAEHKKTTAQLEAQLLGRTEAAKARKQLVEPKPAQPAPEPVGPSRARRQRCSASSTSTLQQKNGSKRLPPGYTG